MAKGSQLAEKCAGIAVREAERAKGAGTFGVGGLLVDGNGSIVKIMQNRVIRNHSVHDPTAHVERQLVDWYYLKKGLPPASMMTIITSLDPCLMCAGSILTGGFNAIHVSQDDEAGVSCRGPGDFSTMPQSLTQKARQTFSSFGVSGKRPFSGPPSSIFRGGEVDTGLDRRSVRAFSSCLEQVKGIVNRGQKPSKLADPKTLAKSSRVFKLIRKYNPNAFSEIDLGSVLVRKAKESSETCGIFNSACIVDPFGNLLLAESSAEAASPAKTPFMELVRKYHRLRFEAGREGCRYLAHIKYCKTTMMLGPGRDPKSLMDLGCFGSCVEGKLPEGRQLQYVIPRQSRQDLQDMLTNLPPLFSNTVRIQDAISQIEDAEMVRVCKRHLPRKG